LANTPSARAALGDVVQTARRGAHGPVFCDDRYSPPSPTAGAARVNRRLALWMMLLILSSRCWGTSPGDFDYYVLSLSWSPQYCASSARPGDPQCARPYAFVVHGLWPQHERGWPSYCGRAEYLPQSLIERVLSFMPSKALILHEWKKHGVCSGLNASEYFVTTQKAFERIRIPVRYQALKRPMVVPLTTLESDFLASNPDLTAAGIASQCSGRYLRELQICLTKDLEPRACSPDLRDRCGSDVVLRPIR
jgi:ribonuclease T2